MEYKLYDNGVWEDITEGNGAYFLIRNYDRVPGVSGIIKQGYSTSIMLKAGSTRNQFFAKFTHRLPNDIEFLIEDVFPFFFACGGLRNLYNPLPDNTSGVGVVELSNNAKGELRVAWNFMGADGDEEVMVIPETVTDPILRRCAVWKGEKRGMSFNDLAHSVPICLYRYFGSVEDVNDRRYRILTDAIAVVNKSIGVFGGNLPRDITSIKVFAEVRSDIGIRDEKIGWGYRVSDGNTVDLVYFMLGDKEVR